MLVSPTPGTASGRIRPVATASRARVGGSTKRKANGLASLSPILRDMFARGRAKQAATSFSTDNDDAASSASTMGLQSPLIGDYLGADSDRHTAVSPRAIDNEDTDAFEAMMLKQQADDEYEEMSCAQKIARYTWQTASGVDTGTACCDCIENTRAKRDSIVRGEVTAFGFMTYTTPTALPVAVAGQHPSVFDLDMARDRFLAAIQEVFTVGQWQHSCKKAKCDGVAVRSETDSFYARRINRVGSDFDYGQQPATFSGKHRTAEVTGAYIEKLLRAAWARADKDGRPRVPMTPLHVTYEGGAFAETICVPLDGSEFSNMTITLSFMPPSTASKRCIGTIHVLSSPNRRFVALVNQLVLEIIASDPCMSTVVDGATRPFVVASVEVGSQLLADRMRIILNRGRRELFRYAMPHVNVGEYIQQPSKTVRPGAAVAATHGGMLAFKRTATYSSVVDGTWTERTTEVTNPVKFSWNAVGDMRLIGANYRSAILPNEAPFLEQFEGKMATISSHIEGMSDARETGGLGDDGDDVGFALAYFAQINAEIMSAGTERYM